MTRNFFGTDGIRGLANAAPMDAETALKVGMAAGCYFRTGKHRHRVVIGKDTRLSGYLLEPALTAGFIAMGMDVFLVGPLPTPSVAMLTRSMRADLGVMISASHNPYHDNGIKLFDPRGMKLSDEVESEIERLMTSDLSELKAQPENLGRAQRIDDAPGRYVEYVKHTLPRTTRLDGIKIVLDCANGAAYKLAPTILWELGAEVISTAVEPNGFNINKNCGSTNTKTLRSQVIEHEADIGIALDGDADRLIVCDEKGAVIDGDQIIGAIAEYWQEQGKLTGKGVVTTVMSNLGLEHHLSGLGLELIRTRVGDRYVIEAMKEKGYNLGGEQSGHIIFDDYTTTGDGLIAALQVLALLVEKKQPASIALRTFDVYPQVLKNVRYTGTPESSGDPLENSNVVDAIANAEKDIGQSGRILIRKSGTEPLIRVMAEGIDHRKTRDVANKLAASIESIVKSA